MKNDMRITYPLWQMGFIGILMGLVLIIGFSSTFEVFDDGGFEFEFSLGNDMPFIFLGCLAVFLLYSAIFHWKVSQHNKRMPKYKINTMSWKPQEYMEDDELFQEITKRATKKVYTYFVWALPLLAGFYAVLPLGRIWMISGLFLVAMGQYWIYYRTIKKYVAEEDE